MNKRCGNIFRTVSLVERQLYEEGIVSLFALCPDFSFVGFYDGLCDGQTQAVTAVEASGLVCPVEALENLPQILFGNGFSLVCNRQQTGMPDPLCLHTDGAVGYGILHGIVQKHIQHLV